MIDSADRNRKQMIDDCDCNQSTENENDEIRKIAKNNPSFNYIPKTMETSSFLSRVIFNTTVSHMILES